MSFGYSSQFDDRVDRRLLEILREAAKEWKPDGGYRVEAYSGYRPTSRKGVNSYHPKGEATDIRIYDASGKILPNYQDPKYFPLYEDFANKAREVQQRRYPDLTDRFRWGGYFSGPKGKYGAMDMMHFDLGPTSNMAGGSWGSSLTDEQRRLFGMGSAPATAVSRTVVQRQSSTSPVVERTVETKRIPLTDLFSLRRHPDHPVRTAGPDMMGTTPDTPPPPTKEGFNHKDLLGALASMGNQEDGGNDDRMRYALEANEAALRRRREWLREHGYL